jgi:hypothetical protein
MPAINVATSIQEASNVRREKYQTKPSYQLDAKKNDEAVEMVDRIIREGTAALGSYYERVLTNIAWAAGNQLVQWRQTDETFEEDPRVAPKRRAVVPLYTNWLRQYIFLQIARLNLSNITWTTVPRTTQLADVQADVAASKVLEHTWGRQEIEDPHAFFENWALFFETGAVYANPEWEEDPEGETVIPADKVIKKVLAYERRKRLEGNGDDQPAKMDPQEAYESWVSDELKVPLEQIVRRPDGSIVINKGKLRIRWYDALSLIEDLSTKKWDDKRFFVLIDRFTLEQLVELYPEHEEQFIKAASEAGKGKQKGGSIRRSLGGQASSPYATLERYTLWLPQSDKYPDGYFVRICSDVVVESDVNPYDHKKVPIVPFFETPDTHDCRPTCTFDDLYILQRAINKIDVQISEFIDETIDPVPIFEEQSVNLNFLQGDPHAEPVRRGAGFPPTYMAKPPIPPHVFQYGDRLVEKFKEIAGLTNPALGKPDSESRSGRAIFALQEAADMRVVVPANGIANGLRRLGEQVLMLIAQFMPEETQIEIAGEQGNREVMSFVGKSFVAKAQNEGPASLVYDIKVDIREKPNPVEVENRLELVLSSGVMDPRINKDDILRALRDNDLSALDPSASDRDRADEENILALAISEQIKAKALPAEIGEDGEPSPATKALQGGIKVGPHQDHGVDIRTHGIFLNKNHMTLHPAVYQFMAQHVRTHQMEQQKMMAMALQARDEVQQRVQPPGRARQAQAAPGVKKSESAATGGR